MGQMGFLVPNSSEESFKFHLFEPLQCGECACLSLLLPMPSTCKNWVHRWAHETLQVSKLLGPQQSAEESASTASSWGSHRVEVLGSHWSKNSQCSTRAPLSQQQRWTMGLSTKWLSFACMNVPADIRKRNLVAFCTAAQQNDILLYQVGEFTTSSLELPCRDMCDMHLDLYSGDLSCAFKSIWYYYDYDLSITYDYILFLQGLVEYFRVGISESRCKFWMYCEVYACLMWFEVHVFSMFSYEKNP